MPRRIRRRTLTGATEVRWPQRTATPHTPNIRPPRMGQWARYRLRRVARVWPRRARTAITLPRGRPQMETSTRTRGAAGIKPRALLITPPTIRVPTLLPLAAMEAKRRAVDHRPLVEAVGIRGRRVAGARQAAVVTEVAGEANG